jgi:hypothetical protein|tara:strand:- start:4180 stop:4503 length:324 start_codon:yes stop_codon:yes gene_type:complete
MSEQPQINVNVNQSGSGSSGGILGNSGISNIIGTLGKVLIPILIIVGLVLVYVIIMALRPILDVIGQLIGVVVDFGESTSLFGLNVPLFILSPAVGLASFLLGNLRR